MVLVTLLFDCVAGLDDRYTGNITGNENLIYINQKTYLNGRLQLKDYANFIFMIEGKRLNKKQIFSKLNKYSTIAEEIDKKWNSKIGMLSGGEIRKFYFSLITAIQRKWYIFDESFINVDANGVDQMIEIIMKLLNENRNIIITTHRSDIIKRFKNINVINLDI